MTSTKAARLVCSFLALTAGLTSTAQAQLATGRSGSSSLTYMSNEEAMSELAAFGKCYAKKRRDEALSLLATRPGSREEVATYRQLFSREQSCMSPGTSLGSHLPYVRGAIAEGLLRSGVGLPATYLLPAPTAVEVRSISDAARCYAARHRQDVQALLVTKPASKREFEVVSAMMEGFAACMPEGADPKFDVTTLRYRLIEGLLRIAPAGTTATQ